MTKEEFAAKIDGIEYLGLSIDLVAEAKAAGLVIVSGGSDDLMEFDGAIHDEFGCYNGGIVFIDKEGTIPTWDEVVDDGTEGAAKRYFGRKEGGMAINAIWSPKEPNVSWLYETDIPHATFNMMEDGEIYCIGIVFHLDDLTPAGPVHAPQDKLQNILDAYPEETFLKADGYDDALVGVAAGGPSGVDRLVYSIAGILDILMTRDGMDITEAEEFFDTNIGGSYIENGPIYLDDECIDRYSAAELGLIGAIDG